MNLLIPVDGSDNSNHAVLYATKMAAGAKTELHLLNVQPEVVSGHVKMFVSQDQINAWYHDEGMQALQSARAILDAKKIPYEFHIGVGSAAETITAYAKQKGCDQIVMGTRGAGAISNLVIGSVATKVIHLADVPITLVK